MRVRLGVKQDVKIQINFWIISLVDRRYRTPFEVAYYRWDETGGWFEVGFVGNVKEAKYIINELKNANDTEYTQEDYLIPYESRGEEYSVHISRKSGEQEYANLVQFNFFQNGNIADLGNNHYLRLSDEVRDLLLDKFI